jgi:hypothetical protein
MKRNSILAGLIFFLALQLNTACSSKTIVFKPKTAPPGQVKKATGSQSAKPYAPGQVKKQTGAKSAKAQSPGQKKKVN